jgi:hypothetical protein
LLGGDGVKTRKMDDALGRGGCRNIKCPVCWGELVYPDKIDEEFRAIVDATWWPVEQQRFEARFTDPRRGSH